MFVVVFCLCLCLFVILLVRSFVRRKESSGMIIEEVVNRKNTTHNNTRVTCDVDCTMASFKKRTMYVKERFLLDNFEEKSVPDRYQFSTISSNITLLSSSFYFNIITTTSLLHVLLLVIIFYQSIFSSLL